MPRRRKANGHRISPHLPSRQAAVRPSCSPPSATSPERPARAPPVCCRRSSRIACIAFFLLILGPCIYGVSQLEPQRSAEQFLPESHPFQRFFTTQNAFVSSQEDESVEMQIVYGFDPSDPIDHSGVNRLVDPKNWGTPKYSPSFVLDAAAQQAMVDDCATLRASSLVKTLYQSSTQTTKQAVFCWPEAFKAYRECKSLSFPVPGDAGPDVYAWMRGYDHANCPAAAFPYGRPTEEELPGYRFDFTGDLGWVREGTNGVKLAWARVRADSVIKDNAYMPATELRVLYSGWEALIDTLNAAAPASLGPAMQVASKFTTPRDNKWLHMILQETYVSMALNGLGIGLTIATLVLLVATQVHMHTPTHAHMHTCTHACACAPLHTHTYMPYSSSWWPRRTSSSPSSRSVRSAARSAASSPPSSRVAGSSARPNLSR